MVGNSSPEAIPIEGSSPKSKPRLKQYFSVGSDQEKVSDVKIPSGASQFIFQAIWVIWLQKRKRQKCARTQSIFTLIEEAKNNLH